MTPLLQAVFTWLVFAAADKACRNGRAPFLAAAAAAYALHSTLEIPEVNHALTRLSGTPLVVGIAEDLTIIAAIYLVGREVRKLAGRHGHEQLRYVLILAVIVAMIAGQVLPHSLNHEPPWLTLLHLFERSYLAIAFICAVADLWKIIYTGPLPRYRQALMVVCAGCLCGYLSIALDLAEPFMPVDGALQLLQTATAVLVSLGFCLPSVSRWVADRRREREISRLLPQVEEIWSRCVGSTPGWVSMARRHNDSSARLHRLIVEALDAHAMHGCGDLTRRDMRLLVRAEETVLADAAGRD